MRMQLTFWLDRLEIERLRVVQEQLAEITSSCAEELGHLRLHVKADNAAIMLETNLRQASQQGDIAARLVQLVGSSRALACARAEELNELSRHFERDEEVSKALLIVTGASHSVLVARLGTVERSSSKLAKAFCSVHWQDVHG